ncbi:Conserved_hypothetical protein [Hexamita inflata]|uniref:ISXO2-like transposase domain-containing protein n=1 Tax=Hexamita inflata TaxID=28002 RepID=A0AA86V0C3_9EUKA|nr:Conserved hypothetical protein [Hexamita inflata]
MQAEESQVALWHILEDFDTRLQYIHSCGIVKPQTRRKCEETMKLAQSKSLSYVNTYSDGIFMKRPTSKCQCSKILLKPPYDNIGTSVINIIKLLWSHWNRRKYSEVMQYQSNQKDIQCRQKSFTDIIYATRNRILEIQESQITHGGAGRIVEIDETFMNRRKFNVGRMPKNSIGEVQEVQESQNSEEYWIFGGVQRKKEREDTDQPLKGFYVMVKKRNRNTLEAEILKHILLQSTIYSDKWSSYNHIIAMKNHQGIWCRYNHFTVNHSKNFLNHVLKSIHTQNIERRRGDLKQNCKRRGYRTGGYNSSIKQRVAEYEFKCNNGVKSLRSNQKDSKMIKYNKYIFITILKNQKLGLRWNNPFFY